MKNKVEESFDDEEAAQRFDAALRGARVASTHRMREFIGKRKSDDGGSKGHLKKSAPAKPK